MGAMENKRPVFRHKSKNPLTWCWARFVHEVKASRGCAKTPWELFLAHFETLFIDSLFFNYILPSNKHRVDDKMWRGGQPHYLQIEGLARDGIRSIINLRGERSCASYYLEEKACKKYGIKLFNFPVNSRQPPKLEILEQLEDLFAEVDYPALIHCKAGSDRAGIMSALYLLMARKQPVEVAMGQLSLRYGHIRQAKTGVLDAFLETYQAFAAKQPIAFMDWARKYYDRDAVIASHKIFNLIDWLTTSVLRRE